MNTLYIMLIYRSDCILNLLDKILSWNLFYCRDHLLKLQQESEVNKAQAPIDTKAKVSQKVNFNTETNVISKI